MSVMPCFFSFTTTNKESSELHDNEIASRISNNQILSLLHKGQVEVSDIEFTLSTFVLFMNILLEETISIVYKYMCSMKYL